MPIIGQKHIFIKGIGTVSLVNLQQISDADWEALAKRLNE